MDWLTWLVTLALVVGGVHWFRSEYLPMLRERAALTDEDRQRERVDVLMALYSLSCGSVRTFVRFVRLRAELGWKHYPLREVLAYGWTPDCCGGVARQRTAPLHPARRLP